MIYNDTKNPDTSIVDNSEIVVLYTDLSENSIDPSDNVILGPSENITCGEKTNNTNIPNHTLPDPLLKNIKVNWLFYLSIVISVYFICKEDGNKNVFIGLLTIILVSASGYFIHIVSHFTNYTKYFDSLDNYITKSKYFGGLIRKLCRLVDFHDETHHDTSINKTHSNIFYEFLLNFITQSGTTILLMYIFRNISYWVVALWGLLYSTIHIINYEFVKPDAHRLHHLDKLTNYGLDIWDVIFNTKYNKDSSDTENINHGSINVLLLTIGIIFLIRKFKK